MTALVALAAIAVPCAVMVLAARVVPARDGALGVAVDVLAVLATIGASVAGALVLA